MRLLGGLGMAAVLLFAGGCIQYSVLVKVKADGSGTIEERTMMTAASVQQMKAMMAKAGPKAPPLFNAKEAEEKAAKMGEGVTLVSAEKVTEKDGSEGLLAVYAFKDINKLSVLTQPSPPGGAAPPKEEKKEPMTFKFEKRGGVSVLTINSNEKEKADAKPQEIPDEQLAMMQMMLKGMKMSVVVEVDGKISKVTGAPQEGNKVTLMEIEMDALLADPANLMKVMATQEMTSAQAAKALAGVKGVKVAEATQVVVEFK